jgi:hypothetical protein
MPRDASKRERVVSSAADSSMEVDHSRPNLAHDASRPQDGWTSIKLKSASLSWQYYAILALAVYTTVMSALFCLIAMAGPRYGRKIHTDGLLTISGAAILTTFLAKTIELGFVTLVIGLLGQVLARRASGDKQGNSITLAELDMRSWILQPGTLVTHWQRVRYAGITMLGVVSLLSAILAMLYVTAANALVQPQLKFITYERPLKGKLSLISP